MTRNTHPIVTLLAVIGALALIAVIGMFLMMGGMMSGMKMPGC
jgi:hypothetical protein